MILIMLRTAASLEFRVCDQTAVYMAASEAIFYILVYTCFFEASKAEVGPSPNY